MSKPKLFVSHSSEDDPLAEVLREKLEPHFEVLIDDEEIRASDDWREQIDRMIRDCHCAVILMTPEAQKSQWVPAEADRLRQLSKELHPYGPEIIPLLVDGFSPDDLRKHPFGPAELNPLHSVKISRWNVDISEILRGLSDVLMEHQQRGQLVSGIEGGVTQCLEALVFSSREALGVALGLDQKRASRMAAHPRRLAVHLLCCDLPQLIQGILDIASANRQRALDLFDEAAPHLWIPREGVRRLSELVLGPERPKPSAGLVSRYSDTPRTYVRCAGRAKWLLWSVKDDFVPPVFDYLVGELMDQVREALALEPDEELSDEELAEELEDFSLQEAAPIVVVLHGFDRQDEALLGQLADKFKSLTFLVVANSPEPPLDGRFPNLVLLPAVAPAVERQTVRSLVRTRRRLQGIAVREDLRK